VGEITLDLYRQYIGWMKVWKWLCLWFV
jgi:hypothetical protein